jgi:multiple sugar transport system substrate-binding protein
MNKWTCTCLLFLLTLACGLGLSAGGQKDAVGPAAIEFWSTQTQSDRQSTIQVIVDTFEALNPQIKITLIPVDENDLPGQVAAAAAAGTLPALGEGGSENMLAFGAEGLLDMEANTSLIKSIGRSKFYAGALNMLQSPKRGTFYALPYHGWIQGIWYRQDWFDDAGLKPPATWEDIETAARAFYQPAKNQYGILVGTTAEVYTEQCFTQFAISNKAQLFDAEGNLIFNSPEMKEAVAYYATLAGYNPPGPQTWRARDYYLQGKMAMFFYSTYIMDDLALQEVAAGSLTGEYFKELTGASFDPELTSKTGFAPIIKNRQPSSYGVVVGMGLYKKDDPAQTAAASRFLEYLYTEDAYVTFLHMAPGGMNPMLKEIAASEKFLDDPKGIYKRYGKEKIAEITSGLQNIMQFGIVEGHLIEEYGAVFTQKIIPQMIYKVTQEKMDIDKAMLWAEAEMKKAIQ